MLPIHTSRAFVKYKSLPRTPPHVNMANAKEISSGSLR
jgi:hypothetical protein